MTPGPARASPGRDRNRDGSLDGRQAVLIDARQRQGRRHEARHVQWGDVARLLVTWALTFLALLLTAALLAGFTYTSWQPLLVAPPP